MPTRTPTTGSAPEGAESQIPSSGHAHHLFSEDLLHDFHFEIPLGDQLLESDDFSCKGLEGSPLALLSVDTLFAGLAGLFR